MSTQSYSKIFYTNQPASAVFESIQNFRGWWSEDIEGNTAILNETFFYHYKDVHLCKIKLIEKIQNEKLVYEILDNQFSFTEDNTEWTGTRLIFEISTENNQTKVKFTHKGLTPDYECYHICNESWGNYIGKSLFNLIETGKGNPNPKEDGGFNAEIVEKMEIEIKKIALNLN